MISSLNILWFVHLAGELHTVISETFNWHRDLIVARDQAAMTLKLMLAVYCVAVAFAAPPGKQGIHINIIIL